MKIFTVRHGQTNWNTQRKLQGHTDIPLDDVGLEQARKLGLRMAKERVDKIFSSDLVRAHDTAKAINAHHNVQITTSPNLREGSFGIYEGRIIEEVAHEIDWDAPDGGECTKTKFARIFSYLDEIVASGHENVVIVAHFGVILSAICYFLNLPSADRRKFMVANTAVHCFERGVDGKWTMTLENDFAHAKD